MERCFFGGGGGGGGGGISALSACGFVEVLTVTVKQANHEQLKCFRNVYCVKTNHSNGQDIITASHKTTN